LKNIFYADERDKNSLPEGRGEMCYIDVTKTFIIRALCREGMVKKTEPLKGRDWKDNTGSTDTNIGDYV